MRRFKAITTMVLCLLLAVTVVGCAGSGEYPRSATPTPAAFTITVPDTASITYSVSVASLSWKKITPSVATFLTNQGTVSASDPDNALYNITTEVATSTPDLASVTGVGIYIESSSKSDTSWNISQLQLIGDSTASETFAVNSAVTVVNYDGSSTIGTSSATGWTWDGHIKTIDLSNTSKPIYLGGTAARPLRLLKTGHDSGAYVWGLMSSGNSVTSVSNLKSFTISSLAAAAGKAFTDQIRLMIQDAKGDWYLSVGGTATVNPVD
jgi:hypothetical protein